MFFQTFNIISLALLIFHLKFTHSVNCGINQPTKLGQLRQQLLCHYDISERPNQDLTTPIDILVYLEVRSYQFEDFKNRPLLTLSCWMPMGWTDEHLKWEPDQWEKIDTIHVNSKEIWIPDITLHNSDNGKSILSHTEVLCEVKYDGQVMCILPVTFEVLCRPNYKKWPYGTQNCWFFFGSWMSTIDYINYNKHLFDISYNETQPNLKWQITQAKSRVGVKKVNDKEFPTLSINLLLTRLPSHYEAYFYPAVLFVTVTNLIVFLINPEKHHKTRFSIIFLTMISNYLVLSYFTWYLPYNLGDIVPDVLRFFRDSLILTMITLLETSLVRSVLENYLWIPPSLETHVRNLCVSLSGKIAFMEFLPDTGIKEKSLEEPQKSVPVQILLVTLVDRIMFVLFFIVSVVYFVVIALDWM